MNQQLTLTNDKKALLLHQLLPKEIPLLLDYIESTATYLKENAEIIKSKWENGFISFESWLQMASITKEVIARNRYELKKSPFTFSHELFACYPFLYVIHCLQQYCLKGHFLDPKFNLAVNILFL
jgi:hypothetical protein